MSSKTPPITTPTRPDRPDRQTRPSYYSNYSDKPLPNPVDQRPGTSGTEAEFRLNIRRMSEELRQAQKAERLYRARKRTATHRANRAEAKAHFQQSVEQFQLGVKLSWAVFTGLPVFLYEKRKLKGEEHQEPVAEQQKEKKEKGEKKEKKQRWKGKLVTREETPEEIEGGQRVSGAL